jgi:hypothetical protein
MYSVHVLTRHNCTLDTCLVRQYIAVARLMLFHFLCPTLVLMLVVSVIVPSVIVIVTTYTLLTFLTGRICTILQRGRADSRGMDMEYSRDHKQ